MSRGANRAMGVSFLLVLGTMSAGMAIPGFRNAEATQSASELGAPVEVFRAFFLSGSPELGAEARSVVDRAVAFASRLENARFVIAGHADRDGPKELNQSLSQARAEAVATAIISAGVVQDKVATKWYGSDDPFIATQSGQPNPMNRRVEISVFGRWPDPRHAVTRDVSSNQNDLTR